MSNPLKNATEQRYSVISRSPTKIKAQRADIVYLHEEFNICEDNDKQNKRKISLLFFYLIFRNEVECVVSKLILLCFETEEKNRFGWVKILHVIMKLNELFEWSGINLKYTHFLCVPICLLRIQSEALLLQLLLNLTQLRPRQQPMRSFVIFVVEIIGLEWPFDSISIDFNCPLKTHRSQNTDNNLPGHYQITYNSSQPTQYTVSINHYQWIDQSHNTHNNNNCT